MTRSAMLEVLRNEYIVTARAKGLSETQVIAKHALRNAFISIITVIGLSFALSLGGAVIIESVFAIPGVGQLVATAALRRDYPIIEGGVLYLTFISLAVNLLRGYCLHPRQSEGELPVTPVGYGHREAGSATAGSPRRFEGLRRISRNRLFVLGVIILLPVCLPAIAAPLVSPYDPRQLNMAGKLKPMSWAHPFGTDEYGRDLFTRVVVRGSHLPAGRRDRLSARRPRRRGSRGPSPGTIEPWMPSSVESSTGS